MNKSTHENTIPTAQQTNVCCHYCRISKNRKRIKVVPYVSCNFCQNVFCANCVENHLHLNFEQLVADVTWKCRPCLNTCCCCKTECIIQHKHCFTYTRTLKRYNDAKAWKMNKVQMTNSYNVGKLEMKLKAPYLNTESKIGIESSVLFKPNPIPLPIDTHEYPYQVKKNMSINSKNVYFFPPMDHINKVPLPPPVGISSPFLHLYPEEVIPKFPLHHWDRNQTYQLEISISNSLSEMNESQDYCNKEKVVIYNEENIN